MACGAGKDGGEGVDGGVAGRRAASDHDIALRVELSVARRDASEHLRGAGREIYFGQPLAGAVHVDPVQTWQIDRQIIHPLVHGEQAVQHDIQGRH